MVMRNVLDGHRGVEYRVQFITQPWPAPEQVVDALELAFVKVEGLPRHIPGLIQLAVRYEDGWGFDPTFWDCVGEEELDYYNEKLTGTGYRLVWSKAGYAEVIQD